MYFPPLEDLVVWPAFLFEGTPFAINKIVLIMWFASALTLGMFFIAGRRAQMVPRGVQNIAEASIDFIRSGIILPVMGPSGLPWTPFLTALFFFIFWSNVFKVIPPFIMPATGRMAPPMFLALMVLVVVIGVGIKQQGLGGFLRSSLFPPGVPAWLYPLIAPIELVSNFVLRPFSLAIRLFANMLAGHILIAVFALLTAAVWVASPQVAILPLPALMLFIVLVFEVLVSTLQAYIFVLLTAVYIGSAIHPEH
jgi:F-type H+-transporting ATPase subunit a